MTIASTLSFLQDNAGAITTGTINSGGPPITLSIAGSEKVRVDSNGYLLVNYSSSQGSYHLQVQGNAYFSGNLTAANINAGSVSGSISTATNIASGSAGNLIYQISSGNTGFVPTGSAGTVLIGTGSAPSFSTNLTLNGIITATNIFIGPWAVSTGSGGASSPYSGIFTITNTTISTSTTTGALQVAGGVGVGGNLYTGGIVNAGQTVRTDRFLQSQYQPVAPRGRVYQGTGALSTITTAIALSNTNPTSIAIDPTGRFAYVAVGNGSTVNQFSINTTTGALTSLTPATTTTGGTPNSITVTPNGRFAYLVNQADNTISQYSINTSTGALASITPATTATGSFPYAIAVDPTGRFAYVANQTAGTIGQYSINTATGALSTITTAIAFDSGPTRIVIDPTGRFAYVGNQTGHSISQLAINQNTGALSTITTAVSLGAEAAVYMAIDPIGRFVYVTTNNTKIVQCSINQNSGALSIIGTTSHSAIMNGLVVDPSGRFLYVINFTNDVSQYSIDQSTGEIRLSGIVTGTSPNSLALAIDPTARFMYVVCNTVVDQFSINNFSAGSGTISGTLNVTSTATSTSTTTGALIVAGGVAIVKDLYIGGTLTISGNSGGDIDMANGDILNAGTVSANTATFSRSMTTGIYRRTTQSLTPAAGTATINFNNGSAIILTLTNAITGWSLVNVPGSSVEFEFRLYIVVNGGSISAWPSGTKWALGSAPTLTTTVGKIDVLSFTTYDGGTSWIAMISGQTF